MEFAKTVEFTQGAIFFNQGKILLLTDVNTILHSRNSGKPASGAHGPFFSLALSGTVSWQ